MNLLRVPPKSRLNPAPSHFRKLWALDPSITFLNHGSFGACPKPVLALQAELRRKIDADQLRLFDEFGIEVPFSRIGQPAVRHFQISAQLYNTLADYEKLGDAMESLSAAGDAG